MGILGTMKTAMSGMDAQSNRVSAVSDNIANVNTIGYKRTAISFSSLVFPQAGGVHVSGGVEAIEKDMISEQGSLIHTGSNTDMAIQGNGFFVVKDMLNNPYLTRSGDFHVNNDGYLQNTAGYVLQGYPIDKSASALVLNGFQGLEKVNVQNFELHPTPTTEGFISANLDRDAKLISSSANTPKSNKEAEYTNKNSFVAYDNLGSQVIYDLYYTKTGPELWEVSVFRQDQSTDNGFPYKGNKSLLSTVNLSFDPITGRLKSSSPKEISFDDNTSGVNHPIKIDISKMTQMAGGFIPQKTEMNGHSTGKIKDFSVSKDGIVDVIYEGNVRVPVCRLAIATVPSVDKLRPCDGNAYLPTRDSGNVSIGFPGDNNRGEIFSGALETSNIDLANELTELIESQRNYAANSKVFQTSSDFMDILIGLKR
ncbi:flagellar hook protein FlgE [Candidatus Liberibacter americanus]|uniref:Flagellar hook protein FlgE n=1 Tax=Candidatus Liberibacter americanus str. Sao Paulo TaxID=1261131 RepID=U6B7Q5_9HYPH|nr:flagellar hook protein FlgE [Candidatus Liberibacter americanus]AHA27757.1 Flagellar hook protein FlgE [Candidatus Liberibacter americanus str. Sao Paulo]EMS36142.1 flagellar hook protein FlgE [Candidatus Liberibacter americanus PW_SP]